MKRQDFVNQLCDLLMADQSQRAETTELASLPGWDSMGQMSTMAFVDQAVGQPLPLGALKQCRTIGDLVAQVAERLDT